ncbi:MAG: NTP transferase domain-containing protein [Candidatus Latescibacteria bacterium]|nr:NTP transferase domain-containing protein [bacterium]MBD3423562.1 NTP transferase domain-containing protein [Candidatus Latescibacterota bacterium]
MDDLVAFILAGGKGQRLSVLTRNRAKPAVPFAGKYRIIDFTLTNCVRSGINHIYVLTQYISRSLVRHLGIGKPWDLDRKKGGLRILHPRLGYEGADWYMGTADALYQNISVLEELDCSNILILSGDHIYREDYRRFLDAHRRLGAEASMGTVEVDSSLTRHFGIATLDKNSRVVSFDEKPLKSDSSLASMGIYIFGREFLISVLRKLKERFHDLDFGKHIIPYLTGKGVLSGYRFDRYWLDIGTVASYYNASQDLLDGESRSGFDLFSEEILTVPDDNLPSLIDRESEITDSIICNGCDIRGRVDSSILSPGVVVEKGAQVRGCVLFHRCRVGKGTVISNTIMDKMSDTGDGSSIGAGDDAVANRLYPDYIHSGITLIGRKTTIPDGTRIGSNCLIDGEPRTGKVEERDYGDGDCYVPEETGLS